MMGKEVLLLEDDLLLGKRIEAYLSRLQIEVTRVETCAAAKEALTEMLFDFALFDLLTFELCACWNLDFSVVSSKSRNINMQDAAIAMFRNSAAVNSPQTATTI